MAIGSKELAPTELDTLRRRASRRRAEEGQGGAVQPALPVGHRPAGEPRPSAAVKRDIARIYTVMRERELGIRRPASRLEAKARRARRLKR